MTKFLLCAKQNTFEALYQMLQTTEMNLVPIA